MSNKACIVTCLAGWPGATGGTGPTGAAPRQLAAGAQSAAGREGQALAAGAGEGAGRREGQALAAGAGAGRHGSTLYRSAYVVQYTRVNTRILAKTPYIYGLGSYG